MSTFRIDKQERECPKRGAKRSNENAYPHFLQAGLKLTLWLNSDAAVDACGDIGSKA